MTLPLRKYNHPRSTWTQQNSGYFEKIAPNQIKQVNPNVKYINNAEVGKKRVKYNWGRLVISAILVSSSSHFISSSPVVSACCLVLSRYCTRVFRSSPLKKAGCCGLKWVMKVKKQNKTLKSELDNELNLAIKDPWSWSDRWWLSVGPLLRVTPAMF